MNHKRRIHDAIVGVVVTAGVALGYYVDPLWLLVPGVIGVAHCSRSIWNRVPTAVAPWRSSPPSNIT